MSVRHELARDIWKAGTTNPDALAGYLLDKGWQKGPTINTEPVTVTVTTLTDPTPIPIRQHRKEPR